MEMRSSWLDDKSMPIKVTVMIKDFPPWLFIEILLILLETHIQAVVKFPDNISFGTFCVSHKVLK